MQKIRNLGKVNWSNEEIISLIPEFLALYKEKPIKDNQGGMKAPHMFATWFMLKKLNPKNVIECGIWKGQGTWLIEKTLPDANIFSIDIKLNMREYISDKVTYFNKDFSLIDWTQIDDKENTLLFFDDHQNAFDRIKKGKEFGFKNFIFEDNYPAKQGDCYSLKKAFQLAGFKPGNHANKSLKGIISQIIKHRKTKTIIPNSKDAEYLNNTLGIYYEFPPVFTKEQTRWGDNWNDNDYPTPAPLFKEIEYDYLNLFNQEAIYYTWICYAKLK